MTQNAETKYWLVGASWGGTDHQDEAWVTKGIWMLGWEEGSQHEKASQIEAGDRIAIKRLSRPRPDRNSDHAYRNREGRHPRYEQDYLHSRLGCDGPRPCDWRVQGLLLVRSWTLLQIRSIFSAVDR